MICSANTYERLLNAYHDQYWVILVNKTDLLPALMQSIISWGRQTINGEDKYLTSNCAKGRVGGGVMIEKKTG